jgi:hypothetical protein
MVVWSSFALVGSTVVFSLLATYLLSRKKEESAQGFTKCLPWIGSNRGLFSWLRAILRSVTNSEEMVQEGYDIVHQTLGPIPAQKLTSN